MSFPEANYEANPTLYSSNVGKVGDIGCYGTVCNVTGAEGKFVDTAGKFEPSIQKQNGGDGYGFDAKTEDIKFGPNAPYPIMDRYTDDKVVVRPGNVTAKWGGKRTRKHKMTRKHKHTQRKYNQQGCKKMGGKKSKHIRSGHMRTKHMRSRHMRSRHMRSRHMRNRHIRSVHHKRSRMHRTRKYRGGNGDKQPYSNIPISFGQTFDTKLSATESALANPVPLLPYNSCASIPRV
jgi:hypothetical protein